MNEGELFAFAGIWDRWKDPSGNWVETCSILTTTPNAVTSPVHDRMPVILDPDSYDLWLDPGMRDVAAASEMLKPYDARLMRCYPISTRINHVANDDEECSAPVELDPDSGSTLLIVGLRVIGLPYWVTVNTSLLVATPPGVVTAIFPVFAPVGTLAVICESESTENVVAFTPPKVTLVVPVKLVPEIVTGVPTGPLVGLKLRMTGVTRNCLLLVSVPPGVFTVTKPEVAPVGTVAVKYVVDKTWKVAAVPLKETPVVPVNP